MAIDIQSETLVPIQEAGPRYGLNKVTGYRWTHAGLEHICIGKRLFTSEEALQRYFDALTEARQKRAAGEPAAPSDRRTDRQRAKASAAAAKRAEARGA